MNSQQTGTVLTLLLAIGLVAGGGWLYFTSDCHGYTAHLDEARVDDETTVVPYEDLSPERQRVVKASATKGGTPITWEQAERWRAFYEADKVVAYQGTYYEVYYSVSDCSMEGLFQLVGGVLFVTGLLIGAVSGRDLHLSGSD